MDSPALMLEAGGEPELGLELGDMLDLLSPSNRSRSLESGNGLSPALLANEQGSGASAPHRYESAPWFFTSKPATYLRPALWLLVAETASVSSSESSWLTR